jgi:hypothetical protein
LHLLFRSNTFIKRTLPGIGKWFVDLKDMVVMLIELPGIVIDLISKTKAGKKNLPAKVPLAKKLHQKSAYTQKAINPPNTTNCRNCFAVYSVCIILRTKYSDHDSGSNGTNALYI